MPSNLKAKHVQSICNMHMVRVHHWGKWDFVHLSSSWLWEFLSLKSFPRLYNLLCLSLICPIYAELGFMCYILYTVYQKRTTGWWISFPFGRKSLRIRHTDQETTISYWRRGVPSQGLASLLGVMGKTRRNQSWPNSVSFDWCSLLITLKYYSRACLETCKALQNVDNYQTRTVCVD